MNRLFVLLLVVLAMLTYEVAEATVTIEPYLWFNKVRDRVAGCNHSPSSNCLTDDGFNDAMFVVFLHCTSCGLPAGATITRITITKNNQGLGRWDTDTTSGAWIAGILRSGFTDQVDHLFLNDPETGAVNFFLGNGAEVYIFVSDGRTLSDSTDNYFTDGAEFTVTFTLEDGSTVSSNLSIGTAVRGPGPDAGQGGPPTGAFYTFPLPEPPLVLSYDGKLRDRVSQANDARGGDTSNDGTFTLTLSTGNMAGFDQPHIVRILLYNEDTLGTWDTDGGTASWTLGVAGSLDGSLFNGSGDGVNISVRLGGPTMLKLFASDWNDIEFTSGTDFTVTVYLADGSQMQKTITIP